MNSTKSIQERFHYTCIPIKSNGSSKDIKLSVKLSVHSNRQFYICSRYVWLCRLPFKNVWKKTAILHGHVISSSGFQSGKSMATSTTNEKHNILKLSEVTARFSMLPTPTINTKASVRQVVAKNRSANRKTEAESGITTQVFSKIGGLSSWFGKE